MSDIRALPTLYREMVLDRAALETRAEGDDRIPMSLSSEYAVERGGYFDEPFMEVLEHTPDAVDLSRAEGGLPLLLDHDPTKQIGVVEDVHMGSDRVLRGKARFSRNPLAQEVRADVLDGIKSRTSIGYRVRVIDEMERASKTDLAVYRASKWTLYENSIVSIPADPTVGVGRNANEGAYPVVVRSLNQPAPQAEEIRVSDENTAVPSNGAAPTGVQVGTDHAAAQELRDVIELASAHGMSDDVAGWVRDGKSPREMRGAMAQELRERIARGPTFSPPVELSAKEAKEYSYARAILSAADGENSFEREVSDTIARKLPQGYSAKGKGNGFFVLTGVGMNSTQTRAGLDSGAAAAGTHFKFVEPGSFIDLLRNKARVMQLGATLLPGLDSPVTFPEQLTAGTAVWMAENSGSDVSDSAMTTGSKSLAAKTLMSSTSYSRQLLRQSVVDVEALVRNDLAEIHALAIDLAAIAGTGASNQPQGILTNTSVSVYTHATDGAVPTYAAMVGLEFKIENANAGVGPMGYLTSPGIKATLKTTQQFATTNGVPVWLGGEEGEVNGYKAYSSNQVPKNLTAGTSTTIAHAAIFGVWSQLYIGEWGALELITDPYRLKKQGMIEVTSFQMVDVMVRRPTAFAVCKQFLSSYS
jgi:HK97 family phage major capsid protein/HK97 family phage prohead protease